MTLAAAEGWGQSQKPACDASTQGRFWPDEANRDRKAMVELTRRGELEMCTLRGKQYQWRTVSVRVEKLQAEQAAAAAAEPKRRWSLWRR